MREPESPAGERKVECSQNHLRNLDFQTNVYEDIITAEHPLGSGCKIPFIHLKSQHLQVQEISRCLSSSQFVCK